MSPDLWQSFLDSFHNQLGLAQDEALHVVYPFKQWNWGGESPKADVYPIEQHHALNVVPGRLISNANAQGPTSGFDVIYRLWLDALVPKGFNSDRTFTTLSRAADIARLNYNDTFNTALAKFKASLPRDPTNNDAAIDTPEGFQAWLQQPENTAFRAAIQDKQHELERNRSALDAYRAKVSNSFDAIAKLYNNDVFQRQAIDRVTGKQTLRRAWFTLPESPWDYTLEITGGHFGRRARNGTQGEMSFSFQSHEQVDANTRLNSVGGANGRPFVNTASGDDVIAKASGKIRDTLKVEISWQDIKRVSVVPGGWYSQHYLERYGPSSDYAFGFTAVPGSLGNSYFFGPGGTLSRIYTAIVVAYRPHIKIKTTEKVTAAIYEQWKKNQTLTIGPFSFDGNLQQSGEQSEVVFTKEVIKAKSRNNWPMIVGHVSTWTITPKIRKPYKP